MTNGKIIDPCFGAILFALAGLTACSTVDPAKLDAIRVARPQLPEGQDAFTNWPVHPEKALAAMKAGDVRSRSIKTTSAGTTGALKVDLRFEYDDGNVEFRVKAKKVPKRLDGINNAPRKEIAAWELQRMFLDPADYVVPTTSVLCIPLSQYELRGEGSLGAAEPTIEGTSCILVVLAVWLKDVTVADVFYDEERFLTDPLYAYYLANYNIFAYLINNRDNRTGNVLVAKDDENRRVFAIDNGVSFGTAWFNWFWPPTYRWRDIRVPALPRKTVDRLRAISREDIDALAVVVQLEADDEGVLRVVEPGRPIDPDNGVNVRGTTVQFGLEDDEIDDVWERIEELLEEVDEGDIPLF